jgi:hypothetical protein
VFPAASLARTVMTLFPAATATPTTLQLVVPIATPEAPVAALVHVTCVTPMLSEALPPMSIGEEAVAYVGDAVGVAIVQVGEVGSYVTVIVSAPAFPAASRARTVITLSPAASAIDAALHDVVPAAVPEAPVPALVHVTVVTPVLSEAVPPSDTVAEAVEYAAKEVGVVIVHVGAVPSYVTVIVSAAALPTASRARTVMTLSPAASATPTTLQLVVPLAVPDAPVAAFVHVTCVTAMLSEAVPPRFTMEKELAYDGDAVGEVIAHVGAVPS